MLLGALAAGGCYSIGYEADPAIGLELAVPVFRNETLRRNLEYDLTRHLRRELLETTSYALAPEGEGVPTLRGTIVRVNERVLIAGAAEEVLYADLSVLVSFGVYRGQELVAGEDSDGDGAPDREYTLTGLAERDTTRGETREGAADEALRDVAEMIALRLQGRRDDRHEPNQEAAGAPLLAPGLHRALIQRDADWFALRLPPRSALRVTLFRASEDLRLRLSDRAGAPLPELHARDGGRILEVVGGLESRELRAVVEGPGAGASYRLLVEELEDDPHEPNQDATQATPLPTGASLRLLSRDEDWLRADLPAGRPLEVSWRCAEPLRVTLCDASGLPLPGVTNGADWRRLEASDAPRQVYVRVLGRGLGVPYELRAR
ncbi:MAG: LPS assembly lipoprotein LptE [Planctomycetota bacterium]